MDSKLEAYNLVEANLLDIHGTNLFNEVDSSDWEYFRQASEGNSYISETAISKVTGKLAIRESSGRVTKASENQLESIHQMEQGGDQIAGVVQGNSAAAQENSAASQQLSAQVSTLRELIVVFKLKE